MNDPHYYCVIMAGGVGSRFWPISREARPKQFLSISYSRKSFLRMTYDRVKGVIPEANILVITLERYRELVRAELPSLPEENLLAEPFNRNTASCIAYATYAILKRDSQAVVLVTPSDQVIEDVELFHSTILHGMDYAASQEVLLTLGVIPTRPDTNYGYIQTDGPVMDARPVRVKTFTEKPGKELAQVFVDSGEFLWNAGIFIWRASVIDSEIQTCAPELAAQWQDWRDALGTPGEKEYLESIYPDMPRTSIDYAVMEKSSRVMVIPTFFDWTDLANWDSLYEYFSVRDTDGNAVRVKGPSLLRDMHGTMVRCPRTDTLIAGKGLKDYMVMDLDDVLLICPRDEVQRKEFLSELTMPQFEQYK